MDLHQHPPFLLGEWYAQPDQCRLKKVAGVDAEQAERTVEPRVMRTLVCLAMHHPKTVSHDELLAEVWPDAHVSSGSIALAISDLRRALGDQARKPTYIKTVSRVGYLLLETPVLESQEISQAQAGAATGDDRPVVRSRPPRASYLPAAAVALLLCGALVLAVAMLGARSVTADRELSLAKSSSRPVTSLPGLELEPAVRADGTLAFLRWQGPGGNMRVFVRDPATLKPLPLSTSNGFESSPSWRPGTEHLAFLRCTHEGCLVLLDQQDGTAPVPISAVRTGGDRRISWYPDGKALAVADRESGGHSAIYRVDVEDQVNGQEYRLKPLVPAGAETSDRFPAVSPSGDQLAFARGTAVARTTGRTNDIEGAVWLHSAHRVRPLTTESRVIRGIAWDADGRHLFVAQLVPGRASEIVRLDTVNGHEHLIAENSMVLRNPAFDVANNRALFEYWTADRNIWRLEQGGGDPLPLIDSTWSDEWPEIRSDGRAIAFLSARSGGYQVWTRNLTTSEEAQQSRLGDWELPGPARWSPDGRQLAYSVEGGARSRIEVVDVITQSTKTVAELDGRVLVCDWSADGSMLLYSNRRQERWNLWSVPLSPAVAQPSLVQSGALSGRWLTTEGRQRLLFVRPNEPGVREVHQDGTSTVLIPTKAPARQRTWGTLPNGVFWVDYEAQHFELYRWSLSDGSVEQIARIPAASSQGRGMALAPDSSWAAFVRVDSLRADIHQVGLP